jgi:hypothetical protein
LAAVAAKPVAQEDVTAADGEAMDMAPQRTQLDIEAALSGVIGKLQQLADKQVQLKQAIEQRWLDDLRQFHGRYPVKTEMALLAAEKSKLFVNLTRSKCNSWEARLGDLLFPTDDKNWGIIPSPAPHLSAQAEKLMLAAKAAAQSATDAHQSGDPTGGAAIAAQGNDAAQQSVSIQDAIEEAEKRCGLMESEIDTQLKDSDYNIRSREVIRDAIKLGTGVMKGPVTSQKLRRSWKPDAANSNTPPTAAGDMGATAGAMTSDAAAAPAYSPQQPTDLRPWKAPATPLTNVGPQQPGTAYVLDLQPDPAPEFVWVDPWSYFPDMSARTPDEAEFSFERHLWNGKQIRKAVPTCCAPTPPQPSRPIGPSSAKSRRTAPSSAWKPATRSGSSTASLRTKTCSTSRRRRATTMSSTSCPTTRCWKCRSLSGSAKASC